MKRRKDYDAACSLKVQESQWQGPHWRTTHISTPLFHYSENDSPLLQDSNMRVAALTETTSIDTLDKRERRSSVSLTSTSKTFSNDDIINSNKHVSEQNFAPRQKSYDDFAIAQLTWSKNYLEFDNSRDDETSIISSVSALFEVTGPFFTESDDIDFNLAANPGYSDIKNSAEDVVNSDAKYLIGMLDEYDKIAKDADKMEHGIHLDGACCGSGGHRCKARRCSKGNVLHSSINSLISEFSVESSGLIIGFHCSRSIGLIVGFPEKEPAADFSAWEC